MKKWKSGGGTIKYIGKIDRVGINELFGQAIVGLCILKPIENYYYSQPIKMYEYMAAGIPFICSDFPGWRKVAEESQAGFCVDPSDTELIRAMIRKLLLDRNEAQIMGRSGREYVLEHCTWGKEGQSLLSLYDEVRG